MIYKSNIKTWLLLTSVVLTACGGGGGGSASNTQQPLTPNTAPSVSAGADQTVMASSIVNLSGIATDSDGSIATFSWAQTAGDSVNLSDENTANASFLMPANPSVTQFSFMLTVTDNDGASASDSIIIILHQAPNVEAGENQTVLGSSVVNLTGSASANNGSIVSYNWEQLSGETVALSNADSAIASFTAPDNAGQLEFTLTVVDSLGAESQDNVFINVASTENSIVGKVTFDLVPFNTVTNGLDYENTVVSPARGIVVEAIDADGNQLESTVTDSDGNFLLNANPGIQMRIRVSAQLLQTEGANWDVKVTDNTNGNALYVTQGELFVSPENGSERNFHLASGWDGTTYSETRAAGPFAILDAIYDTVQKFAAVDTSVNFPPLEIRWSPNNSVASGNYSEGDIGTSFYTSGTIYILGKEDEDSDEYDRHIIIHEWGHYFEDKLSRADSIGGPHGLSDRLDFRVAFGEGWGNAISAIITDDVFYRDSSGSQQSFGWSININNNNATNAGWFNEDSVQSIIYDIYDNDSEAQDNLALGLGPIYSVLSDDGYRNQPYFTTIYSFAERLKNMQSQSANGIDSLLNNQQIYGTGENGLNETNDGLIPSSLPVYKTANINGAPIKVCSVNDAGVYNKLGVTAFVTFQITSPGSYTFTVTESGGTTISDPEFGLFKEGSYIAVASSVALGDEVLTTNLTSTGIYQIVIYDWNNFGDTVDAGSYCFDVQISN